MKVVCGLFQGVCFIRTSRPESNIIYNCNEDFHVGQAKVSSIIFTTVRFFHSFNIRKTSSVHSGDLQVSCIGALWYTKTGLLRPISPITSH